MKKKQTLKNKRFYTTLIKNYILFTLINIIIIVIVICVAGFKFLGFLSMLTQQDDIQNQIDLLESGKYEDIDTSSLERKNGWIEVLDENCKVIFSKGHVIDKKDFYTNLEIEAMVNPQSIPYYVQKYTFKNQAGKNLTLLSKVPKKDIESEDSGNIMKYIKNSMSQLSIIFIVLYIANIIIFIIWLNRRVKKSLDKINRAMKRFTQTNEEFYIEYKEKDEFGEICDSFNLMVNKLKKMEKENKLLEESRQKMLANISHDLKTPITTVQGYAKAILEGYITEKKDIDKYLNIIYKKSSKVTELINVLFEYVKLEHPDFKLNLVIGDLSEFLREIVAENYEHIDDCGFRLEITIPEEQLLYKFDKSQLRRAISNLISNSLKYNEIGTCISVALNIMDDNYLIIIADDGVGIPDEVKKELFVPFVTGDKSRSINGGTGLGLSITRQIIEKHGGSIKLVPEGESCFSTEFQIKLPKK